MPHRDVVPIDMTHPWYQSSGIHKSQAKYAERKEQLAHVGNRSRIVPILKIGHCLVARSECWEDESFPAHYGRAGPDSVH